MSLEQQIRNCANDGLNRSETAARLGMDFNRVEKIAQKKGIQFAYYGSANRPNRSVISDEERARRDKLCRQCAEAGKTIAQTSEETGLTRGVIDLFIAETGVRFVSASSGTDHRRCAPRPPRPLSEVKKHTIAPEAAEVAAVENARMREIMELG